MVWYIQRLWTPSISWWTLAPWHLHDEYDCYIKFRFCEDKRTGSSLFCHAFHIAGTTVEQFEQLMRDIWEIELLLGWTLVSLVRPKAIPNTDKINPTNGRHGQAISILWNLPTCAKLGASQEQLLGHSLFHIVLPRKMGWRLVQKERKNDTQNSKFVIFARIYA